MQVHRTLLDIQGPQQGDEMHGRSIVKESAEDCLLPSYSVIQSAFREKPSLLLWDGLEDSLDVAMVQGRDHGIFLKKL